jgi:hypothetical protein
MFKKQERLYVWQHCRVTHGGYHLTSYVCSKTGRQPASTATAFSAESFRGAQAGSWKGMLSMLPICNLWALQHRWMTGFLTRSDNPFWEKMGKLIRGNGQASNVFRVTYVKLCFKNTWVGIQFWGNKHSGTCQGIINVERPVPPLNKESYL